MSKTWAYDPEVARGNPGNLMASGPALPGGAQQCRWPAVAGPPVKPLQTSDIERESPSTVTSALPTAGDAFGGTTLLPSIVV
jgi:hypothetical protein